MQYSSGNSTWQTFAPGAMTALGNSQGPAPGAVAEVARRVAGIADDFAALKIRLQHTADSQWSSPAATAFRQELSERDVELGAAVRLLEDAAALVRQYARWLEVANSGSVCLGPYGVPPLGGQAQGGGILP